MSFNTIRTCFRNLYIKNDQFKLRLYGTTTELIVTTNDGKIKGKEAIDERGNNFYSFQNIPYAKPPLGPLRFKASVPVEKWKNVLDCTKQNEGCFATNFSGNRFVGSEDCLILNVYTPNVSNNLLDKQKLRPVMFWIHGGGFTSGSSKTDFYGPEYLVSEDVVLVTINYRLGALGFLQMEDPSLGVSGNAGLKDMVMALKWVNKNIKEFGGDPNNVTIFGESAGGAAVHFLILSHQAKGLFHKAISQSGCAFNPWVMGDSQGTKKLALALGITSQNEKVILETLQKMPVKDLFTEGVLQVKDIFSPGHLRPFCPLIEKRAENNSHFICEQPIDIIKSGNYNHVPLIMGCTSREGMMIKHVIPEEVALTDNAVVPQDLKLDEKSFIYKQVAEKIKSLYFKGSIHEADIDNIYRLYTDNYFLAGVYQSAIHHLENLQHPLYFYRFSLDTELNIAKKIFKITEPGASHIDDLCYLFKNEGSPTVKPDSKEDIGIRRMIQLWTNFAKYGNPTPNTTELVPIKWEPIRKGEFKFLDIGNNLTMEVNLEKEAMELWQSLKESQAVTSKL